MHERLTPVAAALSALAAFACCVPIGLVGAFGILTMSSMFAPLQPGTGPLGRLSDSRVRQFRDAEHTVARALKASFAAREDTLGCCITDDIWWDLIAVFPPGAVWNERFPEPLLLDGTVEDVAERFVAALGGRSE